MILKCEHDWNYNDITCLRVCVECGLCEGDGEILSFPAFNPRPQWDLLYNDFKYFDGLCAKLDGTTDFFLHVPESTILWIRKEIQGNPPIWKEAYNDMKILCLQQYFTFLPAILGHPVNIGFHVYERFSFFKKRSFQNNNVNAMWLIWRSLQEIDGQYEWVPMKLTQPTISRLNKIWDEFIGDE